MGTRLSINKENILELIELSSVKLYYFIRYKYIKKTKIYQNNTSYATLRPAAILENSDLLPLMCKKTFAIISKKNRKYRQAPVAANIKNAI